MKGSGKSKRPTTGGPDSAARARLREEFLRPCSALGYDHDQLALHLLSRDAFDVAEAEFRRAAWLNPSEPRFKVHLAWCLYRQNRWAEAREWIAQVPADCPIEMAADLRRQLDRPAES